MNRREESSSGPVARALAAVEAFWQARLPEAFRDLYQQFPDPLLAPCEFFALDAIAQGEGRSFGMLPQFLPFGRAVGEGGLYGFYLTSDTEPGQWPILLWDEDAMYLRPAASDFEAFLRGCFLVQCYEESQWPDDTPDAQDVAERAAYLRLPALRGLILEPVPRNETELYERLVASDPQDAFSLSHLGCARRARGDSDRALDFFHRAIEAAPWFGDPIYLAADTYREREQWERAAQGWWQVVERLLPLCTTTLNWDLGADYPEADIYEVAADCLRQFGSPLLAERTADLLWRFVIQDDPYDPDVREALGDALLAQGDFTGAEREYLNALSLCASETGRQPERLYEGLIALYERTSRRRDAALARFDRALPRPMM
jgi:tetratricopeptide (TPR) repeat protein